MWALTQTYTVILEKKNIKLANFGNIKTYLELELNMLNFGIQVNIKKILYSNIENIENYIIYKRNITYTWK